MKILVNMKVNSDDAFVPEMRAYDPSMLGIFGIYTPISSSAGVVRGLSLNPRISNTRGFTKKFDLEKATADQLFCPGELINGFTPIHADSPRVIMATVQGRHLTPTKVQHPALIGNGLDKAMAHIIGQEFAYKATDDGVVEKIDLENNLCFLSYKNGEKAVIDLAPKAAKNSGGGFYIQNKLSLIDNIKVGSKFKAGTILAKDMNFFRDMADGSTGFAAGRLTKVALNGIPETFEDSSVITNSLVEDMSSDVINERELALTKKSRIISYKSIGDKVEVNDPLIVYEEVGDDETMALAALEKLDGSTKKTIEELARSTIKAKFAGEIFDIRIYYNCELSEMHPTLAKIVKDYVNKYNVKAEMIRNTKKDEIIQQPSTEKIDSPKLFGNEIDGVVIKYFIKHVDKVKIGDKICFYTSLKTIVAETIEDGKEPYSEYRPDEEVSAFLSPLSIVSRMTCDFYLVGWANKAILELKRQVLEDLEE